MSAASFSAVTPRGIAVAPSPAEARRLAHAAELGEVRDVRPGALSPYGADVWTLRRGSLSLACNGTITAELFSPDEIRRLLATVARRLRGRA